MSTDIELVQTALTEFDKVAAGLQQLEKNYKGVLFDVGSTEGMKMAKASRVALRTPRYEVERIRKSAKAPLLAIGKKLDSEAARITAAIMKLEDPIHEQIQAEEDRIEAQKQARIDAENERIADIHARINDMRNTVSQSVNLTADKLCDVIEDIDAIPIDESFQEFKQQAEDAKGAAKAALMQLHAAAVQRETEALRLKAEREELAKLRAEQAERDRITRQQQEEQRRAAEEINQHRMAQQNEQLRQQREALEAEAAANRRKAAEETAKLEADRKAFEIQKAALEAPKAAPLPSAAEREPSSEQILRVLADHFGVTLLTAKRWVQHYWGK